MLKLVKSMLPQKRAKLYVLAATLSVAAMASAQVAGDFPTYKGDNARSGMNGDPNNTGPGQSLLAWFTPRFTAAQAQQIIVDNTDFPSQWTSNGGAYEPPWNGSFCGSVPAYNFGIPPTDPQNFWVSPDTFSEAPFPYLENSVPSGPTYPPIPLVAPEFTRTQPYFYTACTPADSSGDPRSPIDPTKLRKFSWQFAGTPGVPRTFGVSVWLQPNPTSVANKSTLPQHFYVYDIAFGPGHAQHYIDVVDSWASGSGWVRLGNGGQPTNRVFPWDGANTIIVTLYNTVPRDSGGFLSMPITNNDPFSVNRFLVYADAAKSVDTASYYAATPVSAFVNSADPTTRMLVGAENQLSVAASNSSANTFTRGLVTGYGYNLATKNWVPNWTFAPGDATSDTNTVEDNTQANIAGDFRSDLVSTHYAGGDDDIALCQAGITGTATYAPTLNPETYAVYAYIPGNNHGLTFGQAVQYEVIENNNILVFTVDQSQAQGWVQIGNRRFQNSVQFPLQVVVTNKSTLNTDQGLKNAYADAIRFSGERNEAINSTPVFSHALIQHTGGGAPTSTAVVIVADESGHIHCLDATGNGDGTTTEYWTYPSTMSPDPNQVAGQDGVGGLAERPTGFDLSSALVQNIGGVDFLYVGTLNGRVYSLDMAGRGDYTATQSGSTTREWTFPATYPSALAVPNSALGSFRGSIAYAKVGAANDPTIFVPTTQGRLYALNALGNNVDKSTTIRWAFPGVKQPTLGQIWMTPAVAFNKVYFGTLRLNDAPGRFFALDAAGTPSTQTTSEVWELNPTNPAGVGADDYLASPAVVPYSTLNFGSLSPNSGIVYLVNQNLYAEAVDSDSGSYLWASKDLGVGCRGSLTYTSINAFDNSGTGSLATFPLIMVPTLDGRFDGLFARPDQINRLGGKRAWEYQAAGDSLTSSISTSNGWMFGADSAGFLYGWNNLGNNFGTDQVPGQQSVVENNPVGDVFRKSKVGLITQAAYQKLRLPTGDPNQLTYSQALGSVSNANPKAFEWGQTAYILVYDFPYLTARPDNGIVPPPIINISFNVDGKTVRGVAVEARAFASGDPSVPLINDLPPTSFKPDLTGTQKANGYSVLAFPFQGGGANSLPPGNAQIAVSISTQALNNNGAQQNVVLDPAVDTADPLTGGFSRLNFDMANPIAIAMSSVQGASTFVPDPVGRPNAAIGYNLLPSAVERLTNGSPIVGAVRKDLLASSTGIVSDGQTKGTQIYVYDVSMMGLLRPDGLGLDNVRVALADLSRQGAAATVFKGFDTTTYPNFEDLPVNSPNTSLDYPDLGREKVRVTKDPNGTSENPLFNGVTLIAPLVKVGGVTRPMQEGDTPDMRVFRPTPFTLNVDVPKFQPPVVFPNGAPQFPTTPGGYVYQDSEGVVQPQGYFGRVNVFVDSVQNGVLDVVQREAYRGFNLMSAVAVDEKLSVSTPSVDLGSLAGGAGYSNLATPGNGFIANGNLNPNIFEPWSGNYASMFKPFVVENDGNVNMLSLRVAKADATSGSVLPWAIPSPSNDPLSWLDGSLDLWSDMDVPFAPLPNGRVILQKARVADRIPTTLSVNPIRRSNPNLGTVGTTTIGGISYPDALNTTLTGSGMAFPPAPPHVTVSVPIGFPVGRYEQKLRVIEQQSGFEDQTWDVVGGQPETYSDPTFDLLFNVRETRLTNTNTPLAGSMIDALFPASTPPQYAYSNLQPAIARDAFGSLIVGWPSNRPAATPSPTVPADVDMYGSTRLFVSSLGNAGTFTPASLSTPVGNSPLRDLDNWIAPNNANWFNFQLGPYPAPSEDAVFNGTGESLVPGTVKYSSPAFPQMGQTDPFDPAQVFQGVYMGFVGEAQTQTAAGRLLESRLFATVLKTSAGGGVSTAAPVVLTADPNVRKSKPSVVQTSNGAMVFYTGTSGNLSELYYTRLSGSGFGPASALPLSSGFESVSDASPAARLYTGTNPALQSVVDLTFSGQLRGRPNKEVFLARLKAVGADDATGGTGAYRLVEDAQGRLDASNAFAWLPVQSNERLVAEGNGRYRARGIVWNPNAPIQLVQVLQGGPPTNLFLDGFANGTYVQANDTRSFDPQTGVVSYSTSLGGKAYVDPALGLVRFTGGSPSKAADLRLTYQPMVLRVSPGGDAGYAGPTGLFDHRLTSDLTGWFRSTGTPAGAGDANLFNDRYLFTYNRAAAGNGQAARPFMSSMRLGVLLPYRIATATDGSIVALQVTGNVGPFQVDPANGRIYFTASDEDRAVRVVYTGIDDAGNAIPGIDTNVVYRGGASVSFVPERADQAIPIEQAVNESSMVPFLDPFQYVGSRRPPLVWLLWTSTRSGSPDLYLESVAPQWAPVPVGR